MLSNLGAVPQRVALLMIHQYQLAEGKDNFEVKNAKDVPLLNDEN